MTIYERAVAVGGKLTVDTHSFEASRTHFMLGGFAWHCASAPSRWMAFPDNEDKRAFDTLEQAAEYLRLAAEEGATAAPHD